MHRTKSIFTLLLLQCFWISSIFAQNSSADFIRSIGKIYVVVAIIFTVFIGIIIYLFSLERKIKDLEQQLND